MQTSRALGRLLDTAVSCAPGRRFAFWFSGALRAVAQAAEDALNAEAHEYAGLCTRWESRQRLLDARAARVSRDPGQVASGTARH